MAHRASRRRTRSKRGPTGIVLAVLTLVVIGGIAALVGVGGGGDGDSVGTAARSQQRAPKEQTTTTTTTRPAISYTVARGNTLTALARVFGVSTSAIAEANEGLDPERLVEGQVITIPPPEPVSLVVTPSKVKIGGSIEIKLTGALEFEMVRFQIDRPTSPFIGPAHSADEDGEVTTSYSLGLADPEGTYTVTAAGDQGTSVQTTFKVVR